MSVIRSAVTGVGSFLPEQVVTNADLAAELGVVLPISFFEEAGKSYFNSIAVIDADGAVSLFSSAASGISFTGTVRLLLDSLQFVIGLAGLAALYRYVPNTHVRWAHAITGGVFAAAGLELAKKLLAWYLAQVPTYSVVYGTFATVPILLVWFYVAWVIVLLGAVVAAYLPSLLSGIARRGNYPGWRFQLALETLVLAPVAAVVLGWWAWQGQGALVQGTPATVGWLLLAGPMTAVPLLLFAAGARLIPMSTLGILQYISPSLQFALGVWLFHEPFEPARLVGFVLIWAALLVYSMEGWWTRRRVVVV